MLNLRFCQFFDHVYMLKLVKFAVKILEFIINQSLLSAKLRVIVPVKQNGYPSDWDFRDASSPKFHKHYVGWIMWSRKECGIDFLEAWDDGRLQFDILDAYRVNLNIF